VVVDDIVAIRVMAIFTASPGPSEAEDRVRVDGREETVRAMRVNLPGLSLLIGFPHRFATLETGVHRYAEDLGEPRYVGRVAADAASGASAAPAFFVNGQRHHGAYDLTTLISAVPAAPSDSYLLAAGRYLPRIRQHDAC
jgi:hypothetical protein